MTCIYEKKDSPVKSPNETHIPRPHFWLRAIEHRKHELTREYRQSLGTSAREGISDEDYATTMATLEKMARNLGWDETQQHDAPWGRGRPRHPGMDHRHFGRGHGFGHSRRHHDEHHQHGHDENGAPETPAS
ncbi:MAG: hypothetical protein JWP85_1522 [Rhodoglobus sp.]|nr:hypothetical protein [Rhodoglobus sp.]